MTYSVIEQLNTAQIEDLYELYKLGWWSKGREIKEISVMLENSDINLGIYDQQTQKLAGFIRVLTDYVYRAVIWDVLVSPDYQKQGLGSQLIKEVLNHPKLQNVETFILFCLPDMIPFYEKLGFSDHEGKYRFMSCNGNVNY